MPVLGKIKSKDNPDEIIGNQGPQSIESFSRLVAFQLSDGYIAKEPENKIDVVNSLLNNNLKEIIEAHKEYGSLIWYKFLEKGATQYVNPTRSNVLAILLDSMVDLLWGTTIVTNSSSTEPEKVFDLQTLIKLEKSVHKTGEVLMKYDYIYDQLRYRILEKNYTIYRNDFDDVERFEMVFHYTGERHGVKTRLKLVQNQYLELGYKTEKWTEENQLFEQIGGSEWLEIPLSTYEQFSVYAPKRELEHQMTFVFTSDKKLSDVIATANTIDMVETNLDSITMKGRSFLIVPQSMLNARPGTRSSIENVDIKDQLTDSYNFVARSEVTPDGKQLVPELKQTKLEYEGYLAVKEDKIRQACTIFGLSPVTIGIVMLSSVASADSITERERMSHRTKAGERRQRKAQLDYMFKKLNLDVEIDENDTFEDFNYQKAMFYLNLHNLGKLSINGLWKRLEPDLPIVDILKMEKEIKRDRLNGIITSTKEAINESTRQITTNRSPNISGLAERVK